MGMLDVLSPILQDPSYHRFADPLGSFWSNAAFAAVGAVGLRHWPSLTIARRTAFLGCLAVAFGSGWYHANPSDASLVWDRLPMTVVFAAVFTEALASFCHERYRRLLWAMVALGVASVFWWSATGDLRPYALVQFGPMVTIPFLLWNRAETRRWWAMLALYGLAKALEAADIPIHHATGGLASGHTLKHVAAAAALWAWGAGAEKARQPGTCQRTGFWFTMKRA